MPEITLRNITKRWGKFFGVDHLDLDIADNSFITLLGPSGCGKSTLLKLLLRFWSKDSGEILFNGTDIEKINSDNLLDNVTMVSQVTYLFDDTIEENLRIAKPDATQVEMEQACRLASVHDFVMSLPNGYQTRVGAMGDALSSGEKQRLGLARAFLSGRANQQRGQYQ